VGGKRRGKGGGRGRGKESEREGEGFRKGTWSTKLREIEAHADRLS